MVSQFYKIVKVAYVNVLFWHIEGAVFLFNFSVFTFSNCLSISRCMWYTRFPFSVLWALSDKHGLPLQSSATARSRKLSTMADFLHTKQSRSTSLGIANHFINLFCKKLVFQRMYKFMRKFFIPKASKLFRQLRIQVAWQPKSRNVSKLRLFTLFLYTLDNMLSPPLAKSAI